MPVRRHGLKPNPTRYQTDAPQQPQHDPRGLLKDILQPVPSVVGGVVGGVTDAIGLTGNDKDKPKPGGGNPSTTPNVPSPTDKPANPTAPPGQPAPSPNPPTAGLSSKIPSVPSPQPSNANSSLPPSVSGGPGNQDPDTDAPSPGQGSGADGGGATPSRGLNLIGVPQPAANVGASPGFDDDTSNGGGGGSTPGRGGQNIPGQSGSPNSGKSTIAGAMPTGTDAAGPDGSGSSEPGRSGGSNTVVIAVVVSLLVLFLLIGVFFLRRRWMARRTHQHNQWWSSRKRTSKDYQDSGLTAATTAASSRRQSNRSSFGTTIDRSMHDHDPFALHSNFVLAGTPALPPMAELRRSQNVFQYPMPSPTPSEDSHRLSTGSAGSQVLRFLAPAHVVGGHVAGGENLDHRVSFWSEGSGGSHNMEIFTFPAVPTETRRTSEATVDVDPFGDPNNHNYRDEEELSSSTASFHTVTTDPFSDSSAASSSVHGVFEATEPIRRPFVASQPDEISVNVGTLVKVVKVFNDGWARVELVESGSKGLVPIDCLRESGQEFEEFLQAKRVDSLVASANFFPQTV